MSNCTWHQKRQVPADCAHFGYFGVGCLGNGEGIWVIACHERKVENSTRNVSRTIFRTFSGWVFFPFSRHRFTTPGRWSSKNWRFVYHEVYYTIQFLIAESVPIYPPEPWPWGHRVAMLSNMTLKWSKDIQNVYKKCAQRWSFATDMRFPHLSGNWNWFKTPTDGSLLRKVPWLYYTQLFLNPVSLIKLLIFCKFVTPPGWQKIEDCDAYEVMAGGSGIVAGCEDLLRTFELDPCGPSFVSWRGSYQAAWLWLSLDP